MTYKTDLYDHFDRIKRKYLETKDVDYYFLYNGTDNSLSNPKEHNLNYYSDCSHPSGIPVMWDKFTAFISETTGKYDYVIKVNSSTFVNVDKVIEKIKQHSDKEDLYMGYISDQQIAFTEHGIHKAGRFVSGAMTIFSDTTLKKLLEVSNIYKHVPESRKLEDDVLIGLALKTRPKIPHTFLDRFSFECFQKNEKVVIPPEEVIEEALTYPQIRIRNDNDRDIIDKGIWNIIERKLQL